MAIGKQLYNNQVWRVHIDRAYRNTVFQLVISKKTFYNGYGKKYFWAKMIYVNRQPDGGYLMSFWGKIDDKFQHIDVELSEDWHEINEYVDYYNIKNSLEEYKQQFESYVVAQKLMKAR